MPENKQRLNARTDLYGLVCAARGLQSSVETDERQEALLKMLPYVCGSDAETIDVLFEAVWALANKEIF
jgi:hypothetical protein